jgi:DNA-directed RNA polymerase specialized sigma24 family protein
VIVGLTSSGGSRTERGIDFDGLYAAQWWPMLRLAQGLVDDVGAAEDVVQDAFAALYRRRSTLRESRAAVG